MLPRFPVVAGSFYSDSAKQCKTEIVDFTAGLSFASRIDQAIVAGIVPHAGWTFSGNIAAMVFAAIAEVNKDVDTFVIFGAAHSGIGYAGVYPSGSWESPLGQVQIDTEMAEAIIAKNPMAKADMRSHSSEHSIEVQIPFIQHFFSEAKIVPIVIPPADFAVGLGVGTAECIKNSADKKIVCIGSTDLTHYGPKYGFEPMGGGDQGVKWAKEVNDQLFIDAALNMDAAGIIEGESENMYCCGGGAAAATVAAAKALGKTKGLLLAHANSNEVMQRLYKETSEESVGYAGIVF